MAIVFRKLYKVAIDGIYLRYADLKDKKLTFRKIKRDNKLLYPGLELINIKWPNIAKQPNKYRRTKRNLTIIYLIVISQIRSDLIEKKVIKKGKIKITKS